MADGFTAQLDVNQCTLYAFDPVTNSFRTTSASGSSAGSTTSTVMQDTVGPFLRNILFDSLGAVTTVTNTTLAGAAYTPVGAVVPYVKERAKANTPVFNDYSSSPVTTATYVQLIASTTSRATRVEIFNSNGATLLFAIGAAASEVLQFYVMPGGNGPVDIVIPANSRIAVKAKDIDATTGELIVNLYT